MTSEQEYDLTLRDKIAMEIFKILLIAKDDENLKYFYNNFGGDTKEAIERMGYLEKAILKKVRISYKIADLFRKARLEVFK